MKLRSAIMMAGLATGLMSGTARADQIYTNQAAFLAALSGSTTEGFSAPPGSFQFYGSTFTDPTFTISDSSSRLYTVDPNYYQPYYDWNSGAVLDAESGVLTFTTSGVNAIGFNFGNPPGLDSPNSTVAINGVEYGGYSKPGFGFFGIIGSSTPITLTVNFNGGLGIVDNVTTGMGMTTVPLPASAPLFGAALVALGAAGYAAKRKKALPA